jgi:hypothetical protein
VRVEVRPSDNNRIEHRDESRLRGGPVSSDDLTRRLEVAMLGGLAGLYKGFEAESVSMRGFPGTILARWKLPNREAEEVESRSCFSERLQGMYDAGFLELQLQPYAIQPLRGDGSRLFDDLAVLMKHHEVVGIANNLRLARPSMMAGIPRQRGEGGPQLSL